MTDEVLRQYAIKATKIRRGLITRSTQLLDAEIPPEGKSEKDFEDHKLSLNRKYTRK